MFAQNKKARSTAGTTGDPCSRIITPSSPPTPPRPQHPALSPNLGIEVRIHSPRVGVHDRFQGRGVVVLSKFPPPPQTPHPHPALSPQKKLWPPGAMNSFRCVKRKTPLATIPPRNSQVSRASVDSRRPLVAIDRVREGRATRPGGGFVERTGGRGVGR